MHHLITGALVALTATAAGAQNCADRDMVATRLVDGFGEYVQGGGVAANHLYLEVWANTETGTWTITMTTPDNLTCVMASGQHYEGPREREPEGEPL